jgi:diguanylate cyclase (GGDEF)-like protein
MDMFTLHVVHAVLLGLFTVLTVINCRLHYGAKGANWFPAYMLSAFVGALFVAMRGRWIDESVSILLGVSFFHVAYLFLHRGLGLFFERERPSKWLFLLQFAGVLMGLLGIAQFGYLHPNTRSRLVCYSFVFAFQAALIALTMFRDARGSMAVPGFLMGGLLSILSLINLARGLVTMHQGAPINYMLSGLTQQVSLLATAVLQSGITVAFVWMTAAVLHGRLDRLASTDSLTGLLNRRALEFAAEREILLSRKSRRPLTAILIDLDHFKQVNDSFGHSFGDRVLQEVGVRLQRDMRQSDVLARVGGDEFAVMLRNTSREDAMEIAERLRSSLDELVVVEGRAQTQVSASFGLAQVDGLTSDWNELVKNCDKAVYAVKGVGGNLAVAV